MAGTGFFAIMLLRPEWPITGNFVLKFSPSGFGNSLTHSNRRRSNARWEHFSNRNENEARSRRLPGDFTAYTKPCSVLYQNRPSNTWVPYLHGAGTGITNVPSFSAMKFSLQLLELPLPSFFSRS